MVGEDSSPPSAFSSQQSINQVLPVLHLGWNTPLKVSSGCAGPPSPIAQVGITDNLPLYLCRRHHKELPYLLDQTSLSNCRRTLGRAKWNSRHSRILAAANIQVAYAHENKPRPQMAILNEYTWWVQERTLSREVPHFLRHRGRSLCEIENKETDWKCRVGTAL